MFEKNDYIVYGTSGVCRVEDITTMRMDSVSKDRLFYVLVPACQKGGKIFTPVDSEKTYMRRILNTEEAHQLIHEIPHIEELWITNEKQREDLYKKCMNSCDCRQWIQIIKTLYLRKVERNAQGKKVTSVDEKYLKLAEDYLYSELEIPLQVPRDEMQEYIKEQVEKATA